jgi:hypothetical protein
MTARRQDEPLAGYRDVSHSRAPVRSAMRGSVTTLMLRNRSYLDSIAQATRVGRDLDQARRELEALEVDR